MKTMIMTPVTHFPLGKPEYAPDTEGPFRRVEFDGRAGLLATSVHSRLRFGQHTLNRPQGSMTLWVASRDALRTWAPQSFEPKAGEYILLAEEFDEALASATDARAEPKAGPLRHCEKRTFSLVWDSGWYPQFFAKWCRGPVYGENGVYSHRMPMSKAFVAAGHWHVTPAHWYQIGLTWDADRFDYRIFINGMLVAVSNIFDGAAPEPCGDTLVAGNTNFALSDLTFYDEVLSTEAMAERYQAEATSPHAAIDAELRQTYTGEQVEGLDFTADDSWETQLQLSLCDPEHLKYFQVQGFADDIIYPEPEGLRIATHMTFQKSAEGLQRSQGYLWTRQFFEGDQVIEFEFMPLHEQGLSLLCLQAAGMQGEDFMRDYPLRQDGSMTLVYGENVRLYHWEFFREMSDTRNDIGSSALIKQPWQHPLAYQCLPERLACNQWHKLQYIQEGNRLRGSIDGQRVFDVMDDPFGGHGPVFRCGRLAIRLMWRTEMRFRNLQIRTRPGKI